jgi:ubiquitin-conjugating enzyme E2 variant
VAKGYPNQPPTIKFLDKVNLPCVGPHGEIQFNKLAATKTWNKETRIHNILEAIRNEMVANRKLPQPAEGRLPSSYRIQILIKFEWYLDVLGSDW